MSEWHKKTIDLILFEINTKDIRNAIMMKDAIYTTLYRTHVRKGETHIDLNQIHKEVYNQIKEKYQKTPRDAQDWIRDGKQ